jgi:hypothetical protein
MMGAGWYGADMENENTSEFTPHQDCQNQAAVECTVDAVDVPEAAVDAASQEQEKDASAAKDARYTSFREAMGAARDDAERMAGEAAPKIKEAVKGAVNDIAYGAAFGVCFAAAFARELAPSLLKDGLARGAEAGKNAARRASEAMRAKPVVTPVAGGGMEVSPA